MRGVQTMVPANIAARGAGRWYRRQSAMTLQCRWGNRDAQDGVCRSLIGPCWCSRSCSRSRSRSRRSSSSASSGNDRGDRDGGGGVFARIDERAAQCCVIGRDTGASRQSVAMSTPTRTTWWRRRCTEPLRTCAPSMCRPCRRAREALDRSLSSCSGLAPDDERERIVASYETRCSVPRASVVTVHACVRRRSSVCRIAGRAGARARTDAIAAARRRRQGLRVARGAQSSRTP